MRKFKLFFACLLMAVLGIGQVWGENYNETISLSEVGEMLGGSYTSASGYWKVPETAGNNGTITIPSTYFTNQPTSDVTLTLHVATFGQGTNPSGSTVTITAIGAEDGTTWTTSSYTGTLPSSSAYTDITLTLSRPTNPTTLGGVVITLGVNSSIKIFRLQTIGVAYEYSAATCNNSISIAKSSTTPTHGTFVLSNSGDDICIDSEIASTTVTATPDPHYHLASVTSTVGSIGTISNNTCTITNIDDDTEIGVTFEEDNDYTVTWNNNGDESITTQVYEGEKPTFPSTPVSCDGSSTTFIGWANAAWDGKLASLTGKTVHTSNATMDAVTGAVTYYAVFAHVEAGDPSWTLTSIGDLTEDDIFVFADASDYALQNDGGASNEVAAVGITVEEGEITSTVPNNLKWNISGNSTDGYTFYPNGSTATWLYCNTTTSSGNNNNMRVGTGARKLYVIESGTGYIKTNDENTTRYIGRNGTTTFRGYTNTNTNPVVPKFYKYTEGGSTSDYMTTCVATTKCATPTFGVAEGTYNTAQSVTLSCGTAGATIKYTTDGTAPSSTNGTVYSGAITVDKDMTIRAYAYKDGLDDSDLAEAAYVLKPKTPVISGTENFWGTTEVSITCATDGAAIYYKLNDGAETLYENPFTIDDDANIKAVAKKTDWTNSEEATADFTKIVPLTVAQAIEIIGTGTAEQKTGAYVTGIVSELVEFSSQHGNYTYYISDDGTTSNQLQAFRGKDFDGDNFTAATDIAVGDEVVVKGDLLYHNIGGNELNTGNRIIERTKRVVSLALSNDGTAYPVEFTKGDVFSHEHMVVTATYNSTHFAAEPVQENPACTWSGYDANTLGEQKITVSYGGKTANYNITVLGSCTNSAAISKGATEHGSFELSVEGTQCLDELGGNVTSTVLTATPDAHYHVASVTSLADDGVTPVGTVTETSENVYTISGIGANTTITAVFEADALSPWATVYTSNVTLSETGGTNASKATVDGKDALKAGTSSNAGAVQITVPQGTTELHYHAYGWTGKDVTLSITGPDGVTITPSSQALTSNSGMTGNSPFTLASGSHPEYDAYHSLTLSGVPNTGATLTFTSDEFRFVIWGVNAVYPAEITLDPTSYAFGEVKEGLTKSQEFTITANAMCTGDLEAEIIGFDADKFEVSTIAANKVTVTFAPEVGEIGNFTAQLQVSCTNANVIADLTATGISATQPEISVDQTLVEFGSVPQGNPLASQAVAVTLSNISTGATASISGTAFSIDPENLAASGDITITPNTSLAPGNYSGTLTISATGATTKEVTVTMTIQDKWIVTYTSNIVLANNAVVVIGGNNYEAVKAGTGSANGSVDIIVPAHTTKLYLHAAAWNGSTNKTITVNGDQGKELLADAGVKNSTPFTLSGEPQFFSFNIADNAQPSTITIAANDRFVIYGVNVDTYKRDVKVGNYGTLCVKNGGVLSGATLFEIAGKDAEKIYFDEVEGGIMEAGKPYIFLPEETGNATTTITVTYNTTNKTTAGYGNGFYGTYVDLSSATGTELDGNYVISNNRYILVDDDRVTLPAHRAYIKLDEIGSPSAPSGARRRVAISGAPAVVTDIDALNSDEAPRKVMINGQLYIILGEKMFDATGRLVK